MALSENYNLKGFDKEIDMFLFATTVYRKDDTESDDSIITEESCEDSDFELDDKQKRLVALNASLTNPPSHRPS